MGENYEKGIYNQLMDVMARLEAVDQKYEDKILKMGQKYKRQIAGIKSESGEKIHKLEEKICALEKENRLLKEKNRILADEAARLKSIMNNHSSNTSNPPSTDQKPSANAKRTNEYHGRGYTKRHTGAQKGHHGCTMTADEVREKIKSSSCRYEVMDIGDASSGKYVSRYLVDLDVEVKVTEVRIHASSDGKFMIPEEYQSIVIYGSNVRAVAVNLYSEGVMSNDRIARFINAMG